MKPTTIFMLSAAALGMTAPALAEPAADGAAKAASVPTADADAVTGRSSARGHSKDAFLATYDTDKDGKVSDAEFRAVRGAQYGTFDLNGDGKVAENEYVGEYSQRLEQDLAERREMQLKQAHVRYGVLDTDEDRNMTLDEFNESGDRIFSRLDSNGDGVVDARDTADHY
jgi:hypothetical protein